MIQQMHRNKRILYHLLFWVIVYTCFTLLFGFYNKDIFKTFLALLFTLPVDVGFTYFVLYFLIPRYLAKTRYFWFLVLFLFSDAVIVVLERAINFYVADRVIDWGMPGYTIPFWHLSIFSLAININIIVFLAASIKLLKNWYLSQQMKNELEVQNKASELALLRSQISPHFLFNTLNNIHTLITKEADVASDAVVKLSEIMRYMLYDTNAERVPLQKEIDYLGSYIDLQRLRIKDPDIIHFQVIGEADGKMVAPMLFIPFVENACKHGEKKSKENGIKILLIIEEQKITLNVINHFPLSTGVQDDTGGIGLRNVTRRLELLYPDSHDLTIRSDSGKFIVELILLMK
ncbi:MAG: histidine kinase [Bacteroidetes bacterium]|nr:histidine kinase [Bacteroidota bacterium]